MYHAVAEFFLLKSLGGTNLLWIINLQFQIDFSGKMSPAAAGLIVIGRQRPNGCISGDNVHRRLVKFQK